MSVLFGFILPCVCFQQKYITAYILNGFFLQWGIVENWMQSSLLKSPSPGKLYRFLVYYCVVVIILSFLTLIYQEIQTAIISILPQILFHSLDKSISPCSLGIFSAVLFLPSNSSLPHPFFFFVFVICYFRPWRA